MVMAAMQKYALLDITLRQSGRSCHTKSATRKGIRTNNQADHNMNQFTTIGKCSGQLSRKGRNKKAVESSGQCLWQKGRSKAPEELRVTCGDSSV
jgi:hypothetical protein